MNAASLVNLATREDVDFVEDLQFVDKLSGEPEKFTGSTFQMDIKEIGKDGATVASAKIDDGESAIGKLKIRLAKRTLPAGNYLYELAQITGAARRPLMSGVFAIAEA